MLNVFLTAKFKKDLDRAKRRGYNITLLEDVVEMLANGQKLDARYKDHALKVNMRDAVNAILLQTGC